MLKIRSLGPSIAVGIATCGALSASAQQWSVVDLNPVGVIASSCYGGHGGWQVGWVDVNGLEQACLWFGSSSSLIHLQPPGAIASTAWDAIDGTQVGEITIQTPTTQVRHAGLWHGSAATWHDLAPSGAGDSAIFRMSGNEQIGWVFTGGGLHASVWSGTRESWVDLNPAGSTWSRALGVEAGTQVGDALLAGVYRASLWHGSAATRVDLHPAGASQSQLQAISGQYQVGAVRIGGQLHASLWSGTAATWVDLNPPGITESSAWDIDGNVQVGWATVNSLTHASLWRGTPGSWVDLGALLPSNFTTSTASSVSIDGGVITVAGTARNSTGGWAEAIVWTLIEPPPCFTLTGDLIVNACEFSTATVTVMPAGDGPFGYAWRRYGVLIDPLANLSAQSPTLVLSRVTSSDAGLYDCIVANACGTLISTPATLTVYRCCPADLDNDGNLADGAIGDGAVTIEDLLYFLAAFGLGHPTADLDDGSETGTPDGAVTIDDLLFFLAHFQAGC